MNTWKTEKALANMARFFNARMSITEKGSVNIMWLPGVAYEHMDRSGHLDAWKVTKLLEVSRLIALTDKDWLPTIPGSHLIMFAQHHHIYPEFHERAAQNFPMILKTSVSDLGKTALTTTTELIEADEDGNVTPLIVRKNKLVSVDVETRKATPLSQELLDLHGEHVKTVGEKGKLPEFDLPDLNAASNVHTLKVTTMHSDQDFLFHTNQGAYFRFSQDCACIASESNKFRQFDKDLCFYPIRMTQALHKGESWPGEELIVHSWEDPKLNMTLNFVITKNEKEVFYARFQYYKTNLDTL